MLPVTVIVSDPFSPPVVVTVMVAVPAAFATATQLPATYSTSRTAGSLDATVYPVLALLMISELRSPVGREDPL